MQHGQRIPPVKDGDLIGIAIIAECGALRCAKPVQNEVVGIQLKVGHEVGLPVACGKNERIHTEPSGQTVSPLFAGQRVLPRTATEDVIPKPA